MIIQDMELTHGNKKMMFYLKRNWTLYIMLLPATILLLVFNYYPMCGIVIAFQNYMPSHGFFGSQFVGLKWFKYVMSLPDSRQIFLNTVNIAALKLVFGGIAPIVFALLLNEVKHVIFKRVIQTLVYLPHFLSWAVLGGIFVDLLSYKGLVNTVLTSVGFQSVFFLGSNKYFVPTLIITDIWKNFGWGAIIYIAALTTINPELYESSVLDGAKRWKQTLHITIPGIAPVIVLVMALNLGYALNFSFEQVLTLYNPAVYQTGDILDTFVYRSGLVDAQYSMATAVGLLRSLAGFFMIVISYRLAYRFANYRIF